MAGTHRSIQDHYGQREVRGMRSNLTASCLGGHFLRIAGSSRMSWWLLEGGGRGIVVVTFPLLYSMSDNSHSLSCLLLHSSSYFNCCFSLNVYLVHCLSLKSVPLSAVHRNFMRDRDKGTLLLLAGV